MQRYVSSGSGSPIMGVGRSEALAVISLLWRGVLLGVEFPFTWAELPFMCPFVSGVRAGVEDAEGEPFVAACMARCAVPFVAGFVSEGWNRGCRATPAYSSSCERICLLTSVVKATVLGRSRSWIRMVAN